MDADEKMQSDEISKLKIKHDWYQTETHVVVTILAKNAENVEVNYSDSALSVSAKLQSGNEYSLELDLAHFVVTGECSHKIMPSKIEIKLKKRDDIMWLKLEGAPELEILQAGVPKYPSSSKKSKDWNEVEKEITKQEATEQADGDTAVNALFQNIYGNGSDEVRRAMNKSFVESGGTVLSTNWNEVGPKTVERRPPDGMEWKTWSS